MLEGMPESKFRQFCTIWSQWLTKVKEDTSHLLDLSGEIEPSQGPDFLNSLAI